MGLVSQALPKDPFLFLTHVSPELQLELSTKWFCLWQTLIYWLCQSLVTKSLFIHRSQLCCRTVRVGRRTGAAAEEFSQWWGLCRPDSSAAVCCLHRYFYMKSTTESVRPRLGIMRLGVVARHFSPPESRDQNHSGAASNTETGLNMISLCFFHGSAVLALCTQSRCAVLC